MCKRAFCRTDSGATTASLVRRSGQVRVEKLEDQKAEQQHEQGVRSLARQENRGGNLAVGAFSSRDDILERTCAAVSREEIDIPVASIEHNDHRDAHGYREDREEKYKKEQCSGRCHGLELSRFRAATKALRAELGTASQVQLGAE